MLIPTTIEIGHIGKKSNKWLRIILSADMWVALFTKEHDPTAKPCPFTLFCFLFDLNCHGGFHLEIGILGVALTIILRNKLEEIKQT